MRNVAPSLLTPLGASTSAIAVLDDDAVKEMSSNVPPVIVNEGVAITSPQSVPPYPISRFKVLVLRSRPWSTLFVHALAVISGLSIVVGIVVASMVSATNTDNTLGRYLVRIPRHVMIRFTP